MSATASSPGRGAHGDRAAGGRRAERVLDQVREHLQHAVGVGDARAPRPVASSRSATPTRLGLGRVAADRLARRRSARSTSSRWTENDALVQPREVEQVADEPLEPLRLAPRSTPAAFGTAHARRPASASPWPRIEASGVFSSWLTESRNARSASRARSSSSAMLVEGARERGELGGAARPGSGAGPLARREAAARVRDALDRARDAPGRAGRRATAASAAPTSRGDQKAIVNGRQVDASSFASSGAARSPRSPTRRARRRGSASRRPSTEPLTPDCRARSCSAARSAGGAARPAAA